MPVVIVSDAYHRHLAVDVAANQDRLEVAPPVMGDLEDVGP